MRGLRLMLRRSARGYHERLLDAVVDTRRGQPPTGPVDPLAELLRAAAAPARDRELAGEEAAVAAFRSAHRPAASTPRRRRHRFTAGAVAWIAGLAATATAGAALAAVGLDRSGPPPPVATSPAAPPSTTVVGTPTGEPATTSAAPTASAAPSASAGAATVVPRRPTPSASPPPEPVATSPVGPGNSDNTEDRPGLCQAYLAMPERQRERALRTPAFRELVVAAGGAEHVEEYCRGLPAEPDANPPAEP